MTKKYSTKKALMASVLSLALCFSMLVGTTFAWFTDSVTSAGNIIQSGTLDVEMYWAEGEDAVPTTDAGWTDASQGAIFNYDKWEPGYAVVRHIKISNEGTLALKYKLAIVANGEVSDLADVIDVYYVDPAVQVSDRAQLTDANKLGTLTEVLANLANTANGELPAGENDTITLALKMQETAGNEYQNKSIGTSFSVQLLATQLTAENDSFNDQYDKDADYAVTVKTADELKSAIASGNNIVLAADLDLSEWESLNFSAVLDGNGHTISNLKVGLFNYLLGATVKNLKFENADVTGGSHVGVVAAVAYYGTVIEDVTVDGTVTATGYYVGGLVGASMKASNSFISCVNNADVTGGQHVGGIVGQGAYGVNIIGCTNNGDITATGSFGPFAGGIVGFMSGWMNYSDGLVITVEDCVNNGTITSTTVTNAPKIGSIAGALGREGGDTAVSPLVAHINNCTDAANTGLALCGGLIRYNNGGDDGLYLFIDGVCDKATVVGGADDLNTALANGGYVVLTADIALTEGVTVPAGANVTLDLNGHNLTGSYTGSDTYGMFTIPNGASLTIEGEGEVSAETKATADNRSLAIFQNAGELILNGGTYKMNYDKNDHTGTISTIVDNRKSLTINGGYYSVAGSATNLFRNYPQQGGPAILTINDGVFHANSGVTNTYIWNQESGSNVGELHFNGGSYDAGVVYEDYNGQDDVIIADGVTIQGYSGNN